MSFFSNKISREPVENTTWKNNWKGVCHLVNYLAYPLSASCDDNGIYFVVQKASRCHSKRLPDNWFWVEFNDPRIENDSFSFRRNRAVSMLLQNYMSPDYVHISNENVNMIYEEPKQQSHDVSCRGDT